MLNHQLLLYDSQGRVRCTMTGPVRNFNGGAPTRSSLLVIDNGPPEIYLAGLGYRLTGAICTTQPLLHQGGGLLADDDGFVRSTNNPPTFWYVGLPFAANGFMSLGLPE